MKRAALRLGRLPAPATLDEYDFASAELESRLRELPGIIAIYRTGSVSVPGISDLDRIAVVDRGVRPPEIWSTLSAETRSLAMHGPFLVDERTFAKHRWFADLQPLEKAWGETIEIEPRPAPEHLEPLMAAESLIIFTLKLVKQAAAGRVKVRPTLCELNNFKRDLRLARIDRDSAPRAWSFSDEVTRLREEWWTLPEEERLRRFHSLFEQSGPATAEALRTLAATVDDDLRTRHIRLSGSWKNVTVAGGDPRSTWQRSHWPRVTAYSGRLAEATWRWSPQRITVPARVISLLQHSSEYEDLGTQRRQIVSDYAELFSGVESYARLGAAGAFL